MFTLNRDSLTEALAKAQACIETKGTIPALAFALFEVKDGTAKITATDLDVTLTTTIDAEKDDSSLCVPARQLAQLVALFRGDSVAFEPQEKTERVRVTCGSAKHLLSSLKTEHFPVIKTVEGKSFVIKASALLAMLRRTAFAVSSEESRYAMRGVLLETKGGKLLATATDGFRLAHIRYSIPFSGEVSAIVPEKTVRAILKAFDGDDPMAVTFSEDKVQFSQNETTIISNTIVGQYPKYEMIIPKERDHHFTLRDDVITDLKRVGVTGRVGASNHSPEIFFDVSSSGLVISSRDSDKGESEDSVETKCETLNGSTVRLGVASKQIVEILTHEPEIDVGFNDNETPFRITPTGLREYEYVYVVMPVRL